MKRHFAKQQQAEHCRILEMRLEQNSTHDFLLNVVDSRRRPMLKIEPLLLNLFANFRFDPAETENQALLSSINLFATLGSDLLICVLIQPGTSCLKVSILAN